MSENERLREALEIVRVNCNTWSERKLSTEADRKTFAWLARRASNALNAEPDTCHSIYIGNDDGLGSSWICSKCTATIKEDHDWSLHGEPTGYCPGCGRRIEVKE